MSIQFRVDDDGHLEVGERRWTGRRNRTASLHFEPDGLRVSVPSEPTARANLAWADFAGPKSTISRRHQTGWVFRESHQIRNGPPLGVAVQVKGQCADSCATVLTATVSLPRRMQMRTMVAGRRFPVSLPTSWDADSVSLDERDTLSALAALLRARPEVRLRLAQRDRIWQLAFALGDGPQSSGMLRKTFSQREMHVVLALRRGGFRHRFGRPLMAQDTKPAVEVVEQTVQRLQEAHGARSPACQPSFVEAVARVVYLDVEPWPFEALVC